MFCMVFKNTLSACMPQNGIVPPSLAVVFPHTIKGTTPFIAAGNGIFLYD